MLPGHQSCPHVPEFLSSFPFPKSPQDLVSGKTCCFWGIGGVWEKQGRGLKVSGTWQSLRRPNSGSGVRLQLRICFLPSFCVALISAVGRALVLRHATCSLCRRRPETPLAISIPFLFQNYLVFINSGSTISGCYRHNDEDTQCLLSGSLWSSAGKRFMQIKYEMTLQY